MSARQIDLVFLWHMHQPDYRDPAGGGFALPWSYLHAIKDYRALQARGQVELAATPATHPLGPLLLDFAAARDSQPQAPLPGIAAYPGGRERARRHIDLARERHVERFGMPPAGMWPAEGAVSADFVEMLAAAGCRWTASGENVLRNSLASPVPGATYRPWQLAGQPRIKMFFRDDELSDLIGFSYARWHGRDAAADFVRRLEAIAAAAPAGETPLVSVILDGENAWEAYPYNGFYFFADLYGLLEGHPAIRTRTYADWLDENAVSPAPTLPRLVAGSRVHGTLSTWIGDAAKNRAWDLLCEAKQSYDRVMASGRLANDEACRAEAPIQPT